MIAVLQGRVYTINHKRDAAASKPKRRATTEEDDEEAVDDTGALPPQVLQQHVNVSTVALQQNLPDTLLSSMCVGIPRLRAVS